MAGIEDAISLFGSSGDFASLADSLPFDMGGAGVMADTVAPVSDWLPQTGSEWTPPANASDFTNQTAPTGWEAFKSGVGDAMKTVGDVGTDLTKVAKGVTPWLAAGGLGMNIANQIAGQSQLAAQTKLAQEAARRQASISRNAENIAQPVQAFSAAQLEGAGRGELPPGEEARIAAWLAGAKQKMRSNLAGKGQGDSTSLLQLDSWLDSIADQMRGQAIKDMQTTGINAANVAGNVLHGATQAAYGSGQVAAQQQGGLQKLIEDANRAMATMGGAAA